MPTQPLNLWWPTSRGLAADWSSCPSGLTGQASTVIILSFGLFLSHSSFTVPSGILKHATSLRHLKLQYQPVSSVLDMLYALPSSNLLTLAIRLSVDFYSLRAEVDTATNLARVPYALIDEALAHPRFRFLESFSMGQRSDSRSTRTLLSRKAKALMPLANARGMLH